MKNLSRSVLRSGNCNILSPLESDVLAVLWPDKSMRVREIHARISGGLRVLGKHGKGQTANPQVAKKQVVKRAVAKKQVAVSSVAVILDRLHEKGLVKRSIETARGGVRYVYSPTKDKQQFEASVIEQAVDSLVARFGSAAVSYFHQRFSK